MVGILLKIFFGIGLLSLAFSVFVLYKALKRKKKKKKQIKAATILVLASVFITVVSYNLSNLKVPLKVTIDSAYNQNNVCEAKEILVDPFFKSKDGEFKVVSGVDAKNGILKCDSGYFVEFTFNEGKLKLDVVNLENNLKLFVPLEQTGDQEINGEVLAVKPANMDIAIEMIQKVTGTTYEEGIINRYTYLDPTDEIEKRVHYKVAGDKIYFSANDDLLVNVGVATQAAVPEEEIIPEAPAEDATE